MGNKRKYLIFVLMLAIQYEITAIRYDILLFGYDISIAKYLVLISNITHGFLSTICNLYDLIRTHILKYQDSFVIKGRLGADYRMEVC